MDARRTSVMPLLVIALGTGWLLGSGAPWYCGAVILLAGILWQAYKDQDGRVVDFKDFDKEKK